MNSPTRVAFVSLGCAKNVVDSEKMLGQLAEAGCELTADEADADVMVINTCGFLEASRIEADDVIRDAVKLKRKGNLKRIVVAGCLVQRDKEAILERVKGIDALVGVNNRDDVVRAVLGNPTQSDSEAGATKNGTGKSGRSLAVVSANGSGRSGKLARSRKKPDIYLADYHPFVQMDTARLRITPKHYAYLRISEGCDQKCTFCTIPSIRGPMHCKPPQLVMAEARELVTDGAVEISLIGQDTTSYGIGDDPIEGGLGSLLRKLNTVGGLAWVRLMYVYPSIMSDDIIDAIAESDRVCKYIDIPLQHINDRVLKAMHRRIDRKDTVKLMERLQKRIPGVTIRTTMIAGFPGETDAEFEELVQFVKDFRFSALGVFPYSLEPDTPAGRMKNQIPDKVKKERVEALMLAQQDVAFALADEAIGKKFDVLVDERIEEGVVRGRHQGQAPGVDSVCIIESCDANPGDFVQVRCVARSNYDLITTPTRVSLPMLHA